MSSVTDHLRAHLLDRAGVVGAPNPDLQRQGLDKIREVSDPFLHHQADMRILMGQFRYESSPVPYPTLVRLGLAVSRIDKLRAKLDRYEATGNREMLVDAFNYVRMEFVEPCQEGTYYESEERHD